RWRSACTRTTTTITFRLSLPSAPPGKSAGPPPFPGVPTVAGKRPEHVPPFFVPLIGLMLGFVVAWALAAVSLIGSLVAYGLFGLEIGPLPFRVIAFAFSLVFVVVTLCGWVSWLAHII